MQQRYQIVLSKCGLLTLNTVGGKETDVTGLQRIVMCELWQSSLWLRFSCQRRVVHLYKQKERVKNWFRHNPSYNQMMIISTRH